VPFRPGTWKLQQLPSSQFRGHLSRRHAPLNPPLRGGSRLPARGATPLWAPISRSCGLGPSESFK
jgi:hypothetical protein